MHIEKDLWVRTVKSSVFHFQLQCLLLESWLLESWIWFSFVTTECLLASGQTWTDIISCSQLIIYAEVTPRRVVRRCSCMALTASLETSVHANRSDPLPSNALLPLSTSCQGKAGWLISMRGAEKALPEKTHSSLQLLNEDLCSQKVFLKSLKQRRVYKRDLLNHTY